jgi:two-component system sensor histidine kinase VicK
VVGVLAADNRFLLGEMTIDVALLPHLGAFAELCAASLASAEAREQLVTDLGDAKRDLTALELTRRGNKDRLEQLHRDLVHQLRGPIEHAETQLAKVIDSLEKGERLNLPHRVEFAKSLIGRARQIVRKSRFVVNMLNDENVVEPFREVTVQEIREMLSAVVRSHQFLSSDVDFNEQFVGQPPLLARKVSGDLDLIEQAAWELIANACRYSLPKTTITVRLEITPDAVTVLVRDKGIVLREVDKENCKVHGWRSPEARAVAGEGSGVGLSIVDDIVRAHGGKMLVKPTDEGGMTEFGLWIPLLAEG